MGFQFLVEPVGTANHKSNVASSLHPGRQFTGQVGRRQRLTAFVQRYSYTARREGRKEAGFFHAKDLGNRRRGLCLAAAGGGFDLGDFNACLAWHAPGIVLESGRYPGGRFMADGEDMQLQSG